jgi:hypothetical protein
MRYPKMLVAEGWIMIKYSNTSLHNGRSKLEEDDGGRRE